jgi:hypothetical protein
MKTSDTITKIAPALLKAQRSITFAVKDSKNPAFRSTYADLSAVIEACKPALNDAGIAFMQMISSSDAGTIALTTRLLHESGEWIESTATCPLTKNDPQGYGSANTYLRRYSLAAAVGLYQDDDDGNAATRRQPATITVPVSGMSPEVLRDWLGAIAECKDSAIEKLVRDGLAAAEEVRDREAYAAIRAAGKDRAAKVPA